ncbi:GntR family transcriptional regulator [Nocardioides nitrophenolicus]|uniref:GntR family transcriptional regulator n=1 Tax=Nocardioides nitrophenolicus TaxID=60489 RepID=UPI0019599A0B|nr:GntR family transcriptional regulator [Nocardioides nitrophenolicus]MBM7517448.1 DNA-binding GntR family transcriptional regulator [Nocardioides nitrophenolicus]
MITVPAAPVRQEVVRAVRQDIVQLELRPGQRLAEPMLCERYGVSRTVVREALRQLESEGLITLLPNRGAIVTLLTRCDIIAMYEVRACLEGLMGECFAARAGDEQARGLVAHLERMDREFLPGDLATRIVLKDEFYERLLTGADNEVLRENLERIHLRIGIFRHFAFTDDERVRLSLDELRRIVDAAAVRRDPDDARAACAAHIRRAGELAVAEYETRTPPLLATGG